MRKSNGTTAKLSYSAHALMENRNGLLVDFQVDVADGLAERRVPHSRCLDDALPGKRRLTLGADKGYDTHGFVADCRTRNVTPPVAQKKYSAIDNRTSGSEGYAISLRIRKRVEEIFGWMKTVGNFRKTRYVGLGNNQLAATMVATAYNLIRMANLLGQGRGVNMDASEVRPRPSPSERESWRTPQAAFCSSLLASPSARTSSRQSAAICFLDPVMAESCLWTFAGCR